MTRFWKKWKVMKIFFLHHGGAKNIYRNAEKRSAFDKYYVVCLLRLEGCRVLRAPNATESLDRYYSHLENLKAILNTKHPELVQMKGALFHQVYARFLLICSPRNNYYSLVGMPYYTVQTQQIFQIRINNSCNDCNILLRERIIIVL